MEDNILISVIIPVYNIEKYIERCIKSVIGQTYKNIEIILVDDGSTDNSLSICNEYSKKDERIHVTHKINGGLSDARNWGIKQSHGEYITTIDGDDYVGEKYVENLYELISKYNADISSTNRYDFFDSIANGVIKKSGFYQGDNNDFVMKNDEYCEYLLTDKLPHEAWGKLYKRQYLIENEYNKNISVYEDIEFILRILKRYSSIKIVCNMGIMDYYYRRRNDSLSTSNYNNNWTNELKYYSELQDDEKYGKYRKQISRYLASKIIRDYLKIIHTSYSASEIKKISSYCNRCKFKYLGSKKISIKLFCIKHFPKIYGRIINRHPIEEKKFVKKFKKFIKKHNSDAERIGLLFNGPITGNIGDHAIIFGEEKYFKDNNINYFRISAKEMEYFYNL